MVASAFHAKGSRFKSQHFQLKGFREQDLMDKTFSVQESRELLSIRADSIEFRWTKGMIQYKAGS